MCGCVCGGHADRFHHAPTHSRSVILYRLFHWSYNGHSGCSPSLICSDLTQSTAFETDNVACYVKCVSPTQPHNIWYHCERPVVVLWVWMRVVMFTYEGYEMKAWNACHDETQHSCAMGLDTAANYHHASVLASPLHEKYFQLKSGYCNLILTSLS